MMGLVESDRDHGWSFLSCSVIGTPLTNCSVVGLAETVEVLVCCVWRQIVDIHDSVKSIPLSLFSMLDVPVYQETQCGCCFQLPW